MKALVMIADGVADRNGDIIDIKGLKLKTDDVPLTFGNGEGYHNRLGIAFLSVEGDKVYAKFNLGYDKSHPFAGTRMKLYPSVTGKILSRDEADTNVITKFTITSIALSNSPNTDERIEPVLVDFGEK